MNTEHTQTNPDISLITIRPGKEVMTRQKLPYFIGISGESAGAKGLAMHLVIIPPGVPHTATNLSPTEPARAIVTRNDSNEQEDVVPYRMTSN